MKINKEKALFYMKLALMAFILFIVVKECKNIVSDFDIEIFKMYANELTFGKILIIAALGMISYLPLSFYDFVLRKRANIKLNNKRLYKFSFIASSVASIAGFGGSTAIALKTHFYKNHVDDNKLLLKEISRIVALNFTGFSMVCLSYSLLNLDKVFSFSLQNFATSAIALYVPTLFVVGFIKWRKNKNEFEDTMSDSLKIMFISCLEWITTIVLIYATLILLGEKISFISFFPIFVSAILVSIAGMTPGGIGTFDAMLVLGLGNLGVAPEKVLLIAFLYRVTYYIVPVSIGALLFISELYNKINKDIRYIISSGVSRVAHFGLILLVFSSGVVLLVSEAMPIAIDRIQFLNKIINLRVMHMSGDLAIIIGFLLVAISGVITFKSKQVYKVTMILVILGGIISLAKGFDYEETIYMITVGSALFLSKKQFYREGFIMRWGKVMKDIIVLMSFQVFYLYVVHVNIKNKPTKLPVINTQYDDPYFHRMLLVSVIGFVSSLILLYVLYTLNKSANFPRVTLDKVEDKLENILEKYMGAPLIHYVYLNDKYVYINKEEDILIQYQIYANKVVVLGNPIGDKMNLPKRIQEFYELCDIYGYTPVFCSIDEGMIPHLHEVGYEFMKLGEDGGVNLDNFTLEGRSMKSVRNALSRVEKQGYSFEIVNPPYDIDFINSIKEISNEWLDGNDEKGFSVGFFDESYLSRQPIAIVKDSDDTIKGFATFMPMYDNDSSLSIDLMRFSKSTCNGIMDYIFVNLFIWSKERKYSKFNMGLAPLSNVGISKYSFLREKIASQIYLHGGSIYSFQGLKHFKEKYCNIWDSRYVAYKKKTSLIFTVIQIMLLLKKGDKNKQDYSLNKKNATTYL